MTKVLKGDITTADIPAPPSCSIIYAIHLLECACNQHGINELEGWKVLMQAVYRLLWQAAGYLDQAYLIENSIQQNRAERSEKERNNYTSQALTYKGFQALDQAGQLLDQLLMQVLMPLGKRAIADEYLEAILHLRLALPAIDKWHPPIPPLPHVWRLDNRHAVEVVRERSRCFQAKLKQGIRVKRESECYGKQEKAFEKACEWAGEWNISLKFSNMDVPPLNQFWHIPTPRTTSEFAFAAVGMMATAHYKFCLKNSRTQPADYKGKWEEEEAGIVPLEHLLEGISEQLEGADVPGDGENAGNDENAENVRADADAGNAEEVTIAPKDNPTATELDSVLGYRTPEASEWFEEPHGGGRVDATTGAYSWVPEFRVDELEIPAATQTEQASEANLKLMENKSSTTPISSPIYLDNHASTPVDPVALEAMLLELKDHYGNSSSLNHAFGKASSRAIEQARSAIAEAIGASAQEIVFTSGATESNNLAIKGVAEAYYQKGRHLITVATEHAAVLDCFKYLEGLGFECDYLAVNEMGQIDLRLLENLIRPDTILVSVMAANNEIGTLHPIVKIGAICKQKGVLFHTDAAQAVGRIPFHVGQVQADLVSLSAHKLHGPKGIGALYIKRTVKPKVAPQLHGGGQERGYRSGTLATHQIVGFAVALQQAISQMSERQQQIQQLRDRLWERLSRMEGIHLNGHPTHRLAGNLNISIEGIDGIALHLALSESLAVSSGSACSIATAEPSHVLKEIGRSDKLALASIRFGISHLNTLEEIEVAADRVMECVLSLRESQYH